MDMSVQKTEYFFCSAFDTNEFIMVINVYISKQTGEKKGKFSAYLKELAIRILFQQLLSTRYFLAKCISMEEERVGEQKEKEKEHMIINRFQVYIRNKKQKYSRNYARK